jgi:cysteinyl-tRNA synthetase
VLDFALWKAAKPGEPQWRSPWGAGRPCWHIECSVMVLRHLGAQIDLHGGGNDLIFPHHENEIAQSEALTGRRPFAKYWVHNGLLQAKTRSAEDGTSRVEKMSKSLGNTLSVDKLLAMGDHDMLRMFVLGSHYRKPLSYTDESFELALRNLERLKKASRRKNVGLIQPRCQAMQRRQPLWNRPYASRVVASRRRWMMISMRQ